MGRKYDALIDYSKAIECNPNCVEAYVNRGNNILIFNYKEIFSMIWEDN